MTNYENYISLGMKTLGSVINSTREVQGIDLPDNLTKRNVLAFSYLSEANLWHKTVDTLTAEGIAAYLQRFLWRSCDYAEIEDGMLTICLNPYQNWGRCDEFNPNSELGAILSLNNNDLRIKASPLVTATFNNFVKSISNLRMLENFNPEQPCQWHRALYYDSEGKDFNAKVRLVTEKPYIYGYLVNLCFSIELEIPVSYFRKGFWSPKAHAYVGEGTVDAVAYNLARLLLPKGVKTMGAKIEAMLSTCRLYNPYIGYFGTRYSSKDTIIAAHWYPRFKPIEVVNNRLKIYYDSDSLKPEKVSSQDLEIFLRSFKHTKACHLPYFCPIFAFSRREFNKTALGYGVNYKYSDIENFVFKQAEWRID